MAFLQRHKTRWNDVKRHKDGLNADRDTVYSSKPETNVFEFRLGPLWTPQMEVKLPNWKDAAFIQGL